MSAITDIFNSIEQVITSTLPNHAKLTNPYIPELNDSLSLRMGVGFFAGPGINSRRVLDCSMSIEREFTVKITRDHTGSNLDNSIREDAEKTVLEDLFLLVKQLEMDTGINEKCSKFDYSSDNGVEFIFNEQYNYIMIEAKFKLEYIENL